MTVYIVTSGEYSSYQIEAVFTNEEQAELYCATHNNGYCNCYIDKFEADEIKLAHQEIYRLYTVIFTRKLRDSRVCYYYSTTPKGKTVSQNRYGYEVIFSTKKDVTDEQAVKIARDYVYQYRMEQIENEKAELALRMEGSADES